MFGIIKSLFKTKQKHTAFNTKVYRKQIARHGHYWFVVNYKSIQTALQIPNGTSDDKIKHVEKILVKQIKEII